MTFGGLFCLLQLRIREFSVNFCNGLLIRKVKHCVLGPRLIDQFMIMPKRGRSNARPVPETPVKKNAKLKLSKEFFEKDNCLTLCKTLLGKVLARRLPSGEILRAVIVETEAYPGGDDQASKSYNGRKTDGNAAMFMDPGTAYVYFTYGMYHCFNISAKGDGAAVLIRGLEPLDDYEFMHTMRDKSLKKKKTDELSKAKRSKTADSVMSDSGATKKRRKVYELANGPGKLCLAMDIRRDNCDKLDLPTNDDMWLEESDDPKMKEQQFEIEEAKRVGIDSTPPVARNQLWRYFIKDNLAVSTAKPNQILKKLKEMEDGQVS